MKKTRKLFAISIVIAMMLAFIPTAAFADGPSVTALLKGNDVTITVKDGSNTFTDTVQFAKNTTQTYVISGYTVKVEYSGGGMKKVEVVSSPASGSQAPPLVSDTNAPAPKPGVDVKGGDMTWNGYDQAAAKAFVQSASKDKALPKTALEPKESKKTDASGDKIPSNAHSGDYPGLYFYWNDKQKDDGILKVDPDVFDLFKNGEFYITAKNSNAYWDYLILPDKGVPTSEGYLLYQIPRYFMYSDKNNKTVNDELKNINMIFIGGEYKDAFLIINKNWFDEDGNPVDEELADDLNMYLFFNSNAGQLKLGENLIKITDYSSAFYGKKITVTEGAIKGYAAKQNPLSATVKYNDDPVKAITFENQKQKAKITIEKKWDLLPGSAAPEASFSWGPLPRTDGSDVFDAKAGDVLEVKEGGYWFEEVPIDGFTAEGGDYQTLEAEAGGKYTVKFTNKEDRATLTIRKVWEWKMTMLPDGSALPAAQFTNGYGLGTVTVKAGANIAFEEVAITDTYTSEDGWVYSFKFDYLTVDGVKSKVNEVDFDALKDCDHEVVFHNKWEREALPSNVTVVKEWDFGDLPEAQQAKLKGLLDFSASFDFQLGKATEVPADTYLSIYEKPIKWSYDASTATQEIIYTVKCDKSVYSKTAGRDQEYVFTFTNTVNKSVTDKPADVRVMKKWNEEFYSMPEEAQNELLGELSFDASFDFTLGETQKITAGTYLTISENAIEGWEYDASTASEEIIYTVVCDQISYAETASLGGAYEFTFRNTVKKTVVPKTAQVEVVKIWKDSAGRQITDAGFLATLEKKLYFTNGYRLGEKEVGLGAVAFQEDPIAPFEYEGVKYSVAFDSVTVAETNGKAFTDNSSNTGPGVDFIAEGGQSFAVTFVNVVDTESINTGLNGEGKISSTTQYDRWWGYGVLCYSSNSTDSGGFFVAFKPGFWDEYEYARIGFGTGGDIMFYAYFTSDGYELQDANGIVKYSGSYDPYTIPESWGTHYYKDGKGFMGETLDGAWFANPFTSGSRQAYFLELKPAVASSLSSDLTVPDYIPGEDDPSE